MTGKTVLKYRIDKMPNVHKCLTMPRGANALRVAVQDGVVCLWACVLVPKDHSEEQEPPENRIFFYSGTGHHVPLKACYVGSCTDGPFEWHVWEML